MSSKVANQHNRARNIAERSDIGFKPVALPALAAAIQASRMQPKRKETSELPAILRKEAIFG